MLSGRSSSVTTFCGRGNLGRASSLLSSLVFFTEDTANKASPSASARLLFLDISFLIGLALDELGKKISLTARRE